MTVVVILMARTRGHTLPDLDENRLNDNFAL